MSNSVVNELISWSHPGRRQQKPLTSLQLPGALWACLPNCLPGLRLPFVCGQLSFSAMPTRMVSMVHPGIHLQYLNFAACVVNISARFCFLIHETFYKETMVVWLILYSCDMYYVCVMCILLFESMRWMPSSQIQKRINTLWLGA